MLGSFSNSGLGFGVAFRLEDEFSATAQRVEASMRRLDGYTDQLQEKINASMNQMKLGVGLLATGAATLAPFFKGAMLQAEFEQAEIGLTTLLGSAEKAHQVFERIKQDAARTPFETKDLLMANQAIISQGIDAERARGVVLNLGNALSAMGKGSAELGAMSVNLQQIAAVGKASALDMKQFAFRGINMYALLADSTGLAQEKLKDMDITFEMIEQALKKAGEEGGKYAGAMDRMSQSVSGKISTLKDNIAFSFASMGKAIEPITHKIIDGLTGVMERIQAFAESPIGKVVFRLAFAFGILATTIGLVLLVGGGLKMLMFKLAESFTGATRASLLQTMANTGLTGSFTALASAVWAALAPLLPYIAIALAVAAAMYGVYWIVTRSTAAFNEFDATMAAPTGFKGFMMRLGGFIQLIREVWSSWDGLTFSISTKTEERLKKLGIYDTAMAIATWVVRIKQFFMGVWQGMKEAGTAVWGVVTSVFNSIKGVVNSVFDTLGIKVGKNTSDINKWAYYGKIAGYVIIGILGAVTIAFVAMAVAQLAALAPVILAIAAVVAVGWLLYQAFIYIKKAAIWVWEAIKPLRDIIAAVASLVGSVVSGVFSALWTILKAIGQVIWDVVVFAFRIWWTWITTVARFVIKLAEVIWSWLQPVFAWVGKIIQTYIVPMFRLMGSVIDTVVKAIAAVFQWVYEKIMTVVGWIKEAWAWVEGVASKIGAVIGDIYDNAKEKLNGTIDVIGGTVNHAIDGMDAFKNPAFVPAMGGVGADAMSYKGKQSGMMQKMVGGNTIVQPTPVTTNLFIDGDKVATAVNNRNNLNDSRS